MLASVGLGGDGDEIIAIETAFGRFGIEVPVEDAPNWVTVGDVWTSLCRILPMAPEQPDSFLRFSKSLAEETGVDPHLIGFETRLLL